MQNDRVELLGKLNNRGRRNRFGRKNDTGRKNKQANDEKNWRKLKWKRSAIKDWCLVNNGYENARHDASSMRKNLHNSPKTARTYQVAADEYLNAVFKLKLRKTSKL